MGREKGIAISDGHQSRAGPFTSSAAGGGESDCVAIWGPLDEGAGWAERAMTARRTRASLRANSGAGTAIFRILAQEIASFSSLGVSKPTDAKIDNIAIRPAGFVGRLRLAFAPW